MSDENVKASQENHSAEVRASQTAARKAARPAEVEEGPAVTAALAAKPKAAAPKAATKAKAKPAAAKLDKVSGETVRALMAELDIRGKELAAAGGFSLSRVAELRHLGDFPASWGSRDRHATTRQWAEVEKAARGLAAKRNA